MSQTVIKVENLSKLYRLGMVGTGTMAHDLNRWWKMNIQGKDDPYAKIGETNDRAHKGNSEFVWALKDINFEVKQGEVLGIIGRNGAGKSTLLKILSKVTTPTTGNIKIRGRIASLLEVGTGFHPELTGRENVYMNGTIMGMKKLEIDAKFDEIVDFAGVERYIDTPVKRYSSGMMVRLGFAVAAFLEPEIMIIDEVLAVGDAEFQKKCLGKMKDVSTNEGRTVLFVSHNMNAIEELCVKSSLIENGRIIFSGITENVIKQYINNPLKNRAEIHFEKDNLPGNEFAELYSIEIKNDSLNITNTFYIEEEILVDIIYNDKFSTTRNTAILQLVNDKGLILFSSNEFHAEDWIKKENSSGFIKVRCFIPGNFLAEGNYSVNIAIGQYNPNMIHTIFHNAVNFQIKESFSGSSVRKSFTGIWPGLVRPLLKWEILK